MREYGSISPRFWIGETGKKLRGDPEAQVLAMYLMTSPHANMIGVFHCPILYMAHETGLSMEGASKALARLIQEGFCTYDEASETVFVVRMVAHQVGENLKPDDKRCLGIRREVDRIPIQSLKRQFLDLYGASFHLESKPLPSPLQAPTKQLTGTGQEQEQEKDKGKAPASGFALPPWIPPDSWKEFEDHRKKLRKPMTDRARQLIVAELEKLKPAEPAQLLAQSIRNGWQDVFPLKEKTGRGALQRVSGLETI